MFCLIYYTNTLFLQRYPELFSTIVNDNFLSAVYKSAPFLFLLNIDFITFGILKSGS